VKTAATFPETAIDCRALGTHFGIPALKDRVAEIAMLSRPITDAERRDIVTAMNPVEHVLALDGVLVVVSHRNPATALTLDDIARIFGGEITNWSQLGLPSGPINLYVRNENSGTRDTFEDVVMKPRGRRLASSARPFASSSDLSNNVAADPQGIGFVGYAYRRNAKALDIRQSCGIMHHPTDTTIRSEDYPLMRRLFLYTGKAPSAVSTKFVEYALSEEAQPVIDSANFINLLISKEEARDGRERISRYGDPRSRPVEPELDFEPAVYGQLQHATNGAERLSVSFRFEYDSAILDSRAQEDIGRLARYLNTDGNGRRALLAGFTDAKGPFAYNLGLSRGRATQVLEALVNHGVDRKRLTADGFSELLPVSCNTPDDESRRKNRRVEVWLLP
jgi:phosphate transport system substrate-binding protein